jgi:hypothetical protein
MNTVTINFLGETVTLRLVCHTYNHNGRIAIQAVDNQTDEPFGMVSVNIPDVCLESDEVCIKDWSENAMWVPQVLAELKDKFVPTGREVRSGFVSAPVYKIAS